MEVVLLPRLLLISGNGRDSGKTTLACQLISRFKNQVNLVAVKISPHSYGNTPFSIIEEDRKNEPKDSSRMLNAGASRSFFITSGDEDLIRVVPELQGLCGNGSYVICESGGLRKYVNPGVFIIVNKAGREEIKPGTSMLMNYEHQWITFEGESFEPAADKFEITNGKWQIRQ